MKSVQRIKGIATYAGLAKSVREAFARGRERSADAVERERVRTAREVGKLIDEHILLNKERANYGEQVIKRLSTDLGTSHTELKYMLEFVRTYPIGPPAGQLNWGYIRDLLSVNEDKQRKRLIGEASRKKWTRDIIRREIKKLKSTKQITLTQPPPPEWLVPIKGKLDTYRVITAVAGPWKGETALDLGFSTYYLPSKGLTFGADTIVQVREGKPVGPVKGVIEADLFTYRAYLLEVTDGDTLWVLVDLGFGFTTKQQLRLRGLDAPEIISREGIRAKRFVEKQLKNIPHLVITSTRSDKYDRYLADIFYETKHGEQFLNNRLLESGLAQRVEF